MPAIAWVSYRVTLNLDAGDLTCLGEEHIGDELVRVVNKQRVVEVTNQTARVISKTVLLRVGVNLLSVGHDIVNNRSEMQLPVDKGARLDVAAAGSRRAVQSRRVGHGDGERLQRAVASGDVLSVAGHGVGRAVDERVRRQRLLGVLGPVPVRLVSLVAALVAQRRLVEPDELTVPSEEGARAVNKRGLKNVRGLEVVVARASAGCELGVDLRGQLGQALDGGDVVKASGAAEVAPAMKMRVSQNSYKNKTRKAVTAMRSVLVQ